MSLVWKDHSLSCFTGLYYLHCFEFVISAFCAHSCEGCHIVKLKIKRIWRWLVNCEVLCECRIFTCSFSCYIHPCSRKILSRGVETGLIFSTILPFSTVLIKYLFQRLQMDGRGFGSKMRFVCSVFLFLIRLILKTQFYHCCLISSWFTLLPA